MMTDEWILIRSIFVILVLDEQWRDMCIIFLSDAWFFFFMQLMQNPVCVTATRSGATIDAKLRWREQTSISIMGRYDMMLNTWTAVIVASINKMNLCDCYFSTHRAYYIQSNVNLALIYLSMSSTANHIIHLYFLPGMGETMLSAQKPTHKIFQIIANSSNNQKYLKQLFQDFILQHVKETKVALKPVANSTRWGGVVHSTFISQN
jgi:hypothetical protein